MKRVYTLSASFPREEMFGLTSQMRRCAVSIPSNIAEGQGRLTQGEARQFLGHARGSLLELETQLIIAHSLGFASEQHKKDLNIELQEIGRMLNGLIAHKSRSN